VVTCASYLNSFHVAGMMLRSPTFVGWKKHGKLCCTVNVDASGCFQPSLDRIKAYHIWFFVIPSGFSLLCELVLAFDWFIIYRKRYSSQVNRAENFCMENR
jgi:hypothetical protein